MLNLTHGYEDTARLPVSVGRGFPQHRKLETFHQSGLFFLFFWENEIKLFE